MKKLKYIAPVLIALVGLGLQQAKADIYSFDLATGNAAISGFPGPYANVSIDLTSSNTATITMTAYAGFLIGGGQAADFNVNASSWSISNLAFNGTGAVSDGQSNNADGFGSFNQTFDVFDGFTNAGTLLTFTLTGGAGTNWLNAMQVLIANNKGWLAAAHIFVIGDQTVVTGFAGGPTGSASPSSPGCFAARRSSCRCDWRPRHCCCRSRWA